MCAVAQEMKPLSSEPRIKIPLRPSGTTKTDAGEDLQTRRWFIVSRVGKHGFRQKAHASSQRDRGVVVCRQPDIHNNEKRAGTARERGSTNRKEINRPALAVPLSSGLRTGNCHTGQRYIPPDRRGSHLTPTSSGR